MYVIHAPGDRGYYLVENTDDDLSTHYWHHGNYGLQRARKFPSEGEAQAVIDSGFQDAAGCPAQIVEVTTRAAYCASTQVGQKEYWLCPGTAPYQAFFRWRSSKYASYDAKRFSDQEPAQKAAEAVRTPEGAGEIKVVQATDTVHVG
jgi:hypothetical protein